MMKIINKNEGPKVAYEETNTMVFLGDNELMLNMAKYQRDWPVHIDICSNRDKMLGIGTGEGLYYVAQFDVPAMAYTEPATEEDVPTPIPLNMSDVTMTLWSLDNPAPVEN
jgi:hypothetical protein